MTLRDMKNDWDSVGTQDERGIRLVDLSSEELMTQVAEFADQEAFAILYDRHRAFVEGRARYKLKQDSDIQDVKNQTFFNVWRSAHTWDVSRAKSFEAWLGRIADNEVARLKKKAARAQTATDAFGEEMVHFSLDEDPNENVVDEVVEGELSDIRMETFLRAMETLKPADYNLIYRYHIEGASMREIEEELGVNNLTAKMRLYRARQKLKQAMLPLYKPDQESFPDSLGLN